MGYNAPRRSLRRIFSVSCGDRGRAQANQQTEGGFPELKVLKQRIRNLVQPDLDLGHSDVKGKQK